jgi:beta-N-acetylhexosaminidase
MREHKQMKRSPARWVVPTVLAFIIAVACPSSVPAAQVADQRLHRTIGQMIISGFFGTKNSDPGFRNIIHNLEQGTIGGVLFLGRNVSAKTDLETMVGEVRSCKCKIFPIIAVDEEGGFIERLGERSGFAHVPSAAETGVAGEQRARSEYRQLSRKIAAVGFNMNLAPVVDLNLNRANPVIGMLNRSFSDDPEVVSRYASIFIEEHRKQGVLTALKHFPGHGSSTQDSHRVIADVRTSWSPTELRPYRTLIKKGIVDSILVGHLANDEKWGGVATQAGAHAIDRILRRQLKYDGVILSDDLSMDAVSSSNAPLSEVVGSAVRAGIDIVIVSRVNADEGIDTGSYVNSAILEGVKTGELEQSSITLSSRRIRALKKRLGNR